MKQPIVSPAKKQESEGATIFEALLERKRFISQHLVNRGTIKELESMGFKFGTLDLNKINMETQTITATEVPEHKGIELFKKAQAKKKFVTEHLSKGGTVEELRQLGFKFGTLDLHNLTSKRP